MLKEIAISVYLMLFKLLFSIFSLFKMKDKYVVMSYLGFNAKYVVDELNSRNIKNIFIFKTKDTKVEFDEGKNKVYELSKNKLFKNILLTYHMATSKNILVDSYYPFLASFKWKTGVECIQLWHANGAIKRFGIMDKTNDLRTDKSIKRFKKVYSKFTKVIVGGTKMEQIFKDAFILEEERILKTGIPRTDFFFENHEHIKEKFYKENPQFINKKIILYAPTYRDEEIENYKIKLDFEKLYKELKEEYLIIIKNHPLVKNNLDNYYDNFVYDFSNYKNINELLIISDILISDYSSVPFEYSLLNGKVLFYPYDLEKYEKEKGIWGKYEDLVGESNICLNEEEIVKKIKNSEKIDNKEFNEKWNLYNDGNSSKKLVDYLINRKDYN